MKQKEFYPALSDEEVYNMFMDEWERKLDMVKEELYIPTDEEEKQNFSTMDLPKQKAEELIIKFIDSLPPNAETDINKFLEVDKKASKQCALIAVNEMILQNGEIYLNQLGEKALQFYIKNNHFLFEVKKEIENM